MLTIENRAGVDVLVMGNGCRPASEAESAFYAEITRLRAEVAALRADNKHLRGEFEKAWPDAERYRHLKSIAGFNDERDMGPGGHWWIAVRVDRRPVSNTLDAAVDAARAAQGERG